MSTEEPPPPYGAQEYWEKRYEGGDNAFHAWYFTYDELRPLILPLILGGRQEAREVIEGSEQPSDTERDGDEESVVEEVAPTGADPGRSPPSANGDAESEVDEPIVDEEEEDDESEDEEEGPAERDGLAKDGPISVLEVGCGDVPLGAALAVELNELEYSTGQSVASVVKDIICTDYSQVVVDAMRKEFAPMPSKESKAKAAKTVINVGKAPLRFEVADARKLPYDKDSIHLILEKGTLDAMLSDKEEGIANCIQIVAECARVLSPSGYLLIASHLNAHTQRGMDWLEDVVFQGLRMVSHNWVIEVHGNDEIVEDEDDERGPQGSAGPAVYILQKLPGPVDPSRTTIPVKFYSY